MKRLVVVVMLVVTLSVGCATRRPNEGTGLGSWQVFPLLVGLTVMRPFALAYYAIFPRDKCDGGDCSLCADDRLADPNDLCNQCCVAKGK